MSLSKLERQILEYLQENPEESFRANELARTFNYRGSKMSKRLYKALAFLERIGKIEVTSQGKFKIKSKGRRIQGTYRANDKGFGFINYDPEETDLFVPGGKSGSAMHGDTVEVEVIKEVDPATGKGSECQVIKVIERAASQLVGEFVSFNKSERAETGYLGYIIPQGNYSDKMRVYIKPEGLHPANYSICVVEISQYPKEDKPFDLVGYVTKEIGHKNAPGVDIISILHQFNIPYEFPEEVINQANQIPQVVDPNDFEGRRDLRDQMAITIDGADAKDIDDAICLEKTPSETYNLYVHIADVAHYVKPGSPIDLEAQERGTSVYLTDRVVPMLPQRLSNGICSLNPNEDRLVVTCQMEINQKGRVVDHDIYLSVINSKYKMTYDEVNQIIENQDQNLVTKYAPVVDMLMDMADLHHILEDMRHERGALNFDIPEAEFVVDKDGHPLDILVRERLTGERMIESFMLAANETVAREFTQRDYPLIYRVHEQPDAERMRTFSEFAMIFGLVIQGEADSITPKQLQTALEKIEGEDYEPVVSSMMLRSMKQARYAETPLGHYGLAAQDYTHFTAPIRRYPDLTVHRLIHLYLKGRPSDKTISQLESSLPEIADQSSVTERRAVDAERETDSLKKAEYMVDKVGQEFDGIISSVTSFGIFVQLPNTVEGLVTLRSLDDDYYNFNQNNMLLTGERTGRVFRIGQKVRIQVENVDVKEREIDFKLIDAEKVKGYSNVIYEMDGANKEGSGQNKPAKKRRSKKKSKQNNQQRAREKDRKEKRTFKDFRIKRRNQ